jgi:hypothetical protein
MDKETLEKKREEIKDKQVTLSLSSDEAYSLVCCIQIAFDMERMGVVSLHDLLKESVLSYMKKAESAAMEQLDISEEMIEFMAKQPEVKERLKSWRAKTTRK